MSRAGKRQQRASARRRRQTGASAPDVLGFVLRTVIGLALAWFAWRGRQATAERPTQENNHS